MGGAGYDCSYDSIRQTSKEMYATNLLLLGTALLTLSATAVQSECRYEYFQQPPTEVSCNPYGSQLQLHCAANGPLEPEYALEWYSGTPGDPAVRLSEQPEYNIMSVMLNTGSEDIRGVLSTLLTTEISSRHTENCFWCTIEISGQPLNVSSNKLCMLQETAYMSFDGCSGLLPVDQTVLCVNETLVLAIQPTTHSSEILQTISPSRSAMQLLMTPGSTNGGGGGEIARGIYVAVAVCVVFVVVIALLAVIIFFLCTKRKCVDKYFQRAGREARIQPSRPRENMRNGEHYPVLANTVAENSDMQTPRVSPSRNEHKAGSKPRDEPDYSTLDNQTPAAAANTAVNKYDHLNPNNTDGNQPSIASTIPPKKPPRSRSRDHFYHSLECSNDNAHRSSSNSLNRRSITILASQIKDLFDDPNYAALTVESRGGQLGERDLSRSTPSLVTAGVQLHPPYVWERASFRMVRNKRRSDIIDRDS